MSDQEITDDLHTRVASVNTVLREMTKQGLEVEFSREMEGTCAELRCMVHREIKPSTKEKGA